MSVGKSRVVTVFSLYKPSLTTYPNFNFPNKGTNYTQRADKER